MFAQIRNAQIGDQTAIRAQVQDYLKELSAFANVEETYVYFYDYWSDSTRWPYVIEVDDEPVGFIFINQWSPSGRGTDHAVAEFYIAPRWRGQRHGKEAARQILQKHPGQWELAFFNANVTAQAFWPVAIAQAGAASLERLGDTNTTILRFVIPARIALQDEPQRRSSHVPT
jgi:predicted acetyltransferase